MNLLEKLFPTAGGRTVHEVAKHLGIDPEQASAAVSTMLPQLAGGVKDKLATGDKSAVTDALQSGKNTQFADDPSSLSPQEVHEHGKSMLSGIFGPEGDLSATLAEKTGISRDVINRLLPVAAALLGAFLLRRTQAGANLEQAAGHVENAGGGKPFTSKTSG